MSNYLKRKQAESDARKQEAKKTAIIIGCVVVALALIVGAIILIKNSQKKPTGSASGNLGDPNYDIFDYVTLGQYEGIEAYRIIPEVTDEQVQSQIDSYLEDGVEYSDIPQRAIQKGDEITIDFVGTIDGVEFDGGTGEDHRYTYLNGEMIPGFDEAMEGLWVGETVSFDVTFPDDYSTEALQGQTANFNVTLKAAQEISYQPEWNDEFVVKYTGGEYATTDAYKEKIYNDLMESAKADSESQLQDDVFEAVVANTTFNGYPEYLYNVVYNSLYNNVSYYASMFGIDVEQYMQYFGGGMTFKEYAEKMTYSRMTQEALIKTLNIEITDEEYQEFASDLAVQYSMSSVEELEKTYAKDDIIEYYQSNKLFDILVEKASVTDVSQEQYNELTKTEEDADVEE